MPARRRDSRDRTSGSVSAPLPDGGTGSWAALWIRRGPAEWEPVVLLDGGSVYGITDRRPDGVLLAAGIAARSTGGCCQPVRWTVTIGTVGSVSTVREPVGSDYSAGQGLGINATGDVAGYGWKGAFGAAQPLLFPWTGGTVKLPKAKNAAGRAFGVSADAWLAGFVDDRAVVWRP